MTSRCFAQGCDARAKKHGCSKHLIAGRLRIYTVFTAYGVEDMTSLGLLLA